MFTVKHIMTNGHETIYHAREVNYVPANENTGEVDPGEAIVHFDITASASNVPGDSYVYISSGRVYVMNANGKTVADYVLRTKAFPHGLAPSQAA